jgi:hypothetical protein
MSQAARRFYLDTYMPILRALRAPRRQCTFRRWRNRAASGEGAKEAARDFRYPLEITD